ncbi:MFS general substrate transporter [Artomyces pyxidatus]|uniref:MFS general substrate transporter n=1 Tax=Artomyces pyxidatus TaxID=48021 RepID=A0ACB8T3Z8_9AGAM|nr:MFS general substrate transporter [Artomyces pyxidatus]
MSSSEHQRTPPEEARPPWGLKWRSSVWFITTVVGMGITTDLLVYSIVIPVLPFHLEGLDYSNVSALVGYLLFAYSGGLVVSTPPIAWISERFNARKLPLVLGLVALIGSQIMLMEAPVYWVMALARVIQGISSSVVWVVGLALLCDTTPEKYIGRQLGLAMSGLSLGLLVGPPVGGALYTRFGFRGPIIFGVIVTFIDLLGRFLIIERYEALRWGVDPGALDTADSEAQEIKSDPTAAYGTFEGPSTQPLDPQGADSSAVPSTSNVEAPTTEKSEGARTTVSSPTVSPPPRLSSMKVIAKLAKSSRALVALFNTIIYGIMFTSQEPALPLHLNQVWGLDSSKVGLVYIASVVPTLLSSPFAGWWADHKGPEWITVGCLVLSVPWFGIVIIQKQLALFITAFALEYFFLAGVVAPLTSELAAVSRSLPGVGYAHVYGAFNLAYGIGAALGPLIGGQIFSHVNRGWMVLNVLSICLVTVSIVLAFVYTGEQPLLKMFAARIKPLGVSKDTSHAQEGEPAQETKKDM